MECAISPPPNDPVERTAGLRSLPAAAHRERRPDKQEANVTTVRQTTVGAAVTRLSPWLAAHLLLVAAYLVAAALAAAQPAGKRPSR